MSKIHRIKIARNRYASDDNPERFFVNPRKIGKRITGLKMDMQSYISFAPMSEKEKAERGWEEMYQVVTIIDVVIPDLRQLDEIWADDND